MLSLIPSWCVCEIVTIEIQVIIKPILTGLAMELIKQLHNLKIRPTSPWVMLIKIKLLNKANVHCYLCVLLGKIMTYLFTIIFSIIHCGTF